MLELKTIRKLTSEEIKKILDSKLKFLIEDKTLVLFAKSDPKLLETFHLVQIENKVRQEAKKVSAAIKE